MQRDGIILERIFSNLILGTDYELKNRYMIIKISTTKRSEVAAKVGKRLEV